MMLRGPDSHSDRFLHDLTQINDRIAKAERQISSGKRVNSASDAPDEVSYLLSLRSTLSSTTQTKTNLGLVKTEVDTAEQALGHAVELLDRVVTLGSQGASGTSDADTRKTLSGEVETILGQLVNVANTEIAGRYLFAGDTDQVQPYDFDASQDDAVTPYQGSASTRQVTHPSGSRFPVAKTAQTVFEAPDPANDVFGSINALRNALRDNDADGIRTALANVRTAAKYLNTQQAFYGTAQNQVTEATDFSEKQIVRVKQQIADVEDADVTAAILDLNSARQNQETALAAEARRPTTTLFDYLR